MSAPHRCMVCEHRPGPRVVAATIKEPKANLRDLTEPRVHKKPCHCFCHQPREAS